MEEFKWSNHSKMLPLEKLARLSSSAHEEYRTATPFEHIVFDDVYDPRILEAVIGEFELAEENWRTFNSKFEKKSQMNKDEMMGPITRSFIHNLNSAPFLEFLTKVTGIEGLIPDPYLHGAGLHKISKGGKLGVHIDFNGHKIMAVKRRLNILIYLNKNWLPEWGGDFQLWSEDKLKCEKQIYPDFNRMVIFSTTDKSFHGHPEPLNCPENQDRLSIALYYYTVNGPVNSDGKFHSTVFLNEKGSREELMRKETMLQRIIRTIRKAY